MVLVWQPIIDLPEDWGSLSDGELAPLLQFWNDQRVDLEQSGASKIFAERLSREWSIETGQIEGVYNLDRGITQTLIEHGINADLIPPQPGQKPPELIAAIIQDHADVLEGLFQFVKGERPISKSYVHELHSALLRHQDTAVMMDQFGTLFEARLIKGKYKEHPNNPRRPDGGIHQYSPPEQVDSEMERLLAWHIEHVKKDVPVEVEAAWLHHRFTQIHPYQDGNGRVARALASLVFLKAGWFPVVVGREDRARYIEALESADDSDVRLLVALFVDLQKRALFQGVQAAADTQTITTVDAAISAAKRVLTGPVKGLESVAWLKAKRTADQLVKGIVEKRLEEIVVALRQQIGNDRPELRFATGSVEGTFPILDTLNYRANSLEYHNARVAILSREKAAHIVIHAHAVGSKPRGLVGIVAIFQRESGTYEFASKESFLVNYAESYEAAERRFRPWLEESLVNALTMWRKSL